MLFYANRLYRVTQKCSNLNIRFISGLNLWNEELNSEIKHKIEQHWKGKLPKYGLNECGDTKEKFYVLSMFPYPSGSLHMGHVRVYTISDAIARFQRMNGKNVIHPIGWDAFGLPAENAAIERQIAPDDWTKKNILQMKTQLQRLGCSFDWDRELATCNPLYYKWTQDLFLKLFDAGLVYQKEAIVNWDPIDKTVLADEQVDENGCSWRSKAKVEKIIFKQWFIRTTRFAKDLLEGLDDSVLQDWKDVIKLQRHWIGECNGVNFDFKLINTNDFVTLWTSQPEYIKHAKFIAITPSHILSRYNSTNVDNSTKKLDVKAIHPLTQQEIPIFITDQIEFLPQTDSFLGIPCACDQSAQFSEKYQIAYDTFEINDNEKIIMRDKVCQEAQVKGVGGYWTSGKLRDWLISRQRFWGTPIPIIHCDTCGVQPVRDLPVSLPKLTKLNLKLSDVYEWVNCVCPKCHKSAKRETDTMDTFVDSSWYYLRYLDPKNNEEIFSKRKSYDLMPVDLYVGGKEHAVLHLYYARFISHFLHSLNLLPEREPFKRLLVQGMVMGRSYRIKGTGRYVTENEVKVLDMKKNKAVMEATGEPVVMAWEKMSKSKKNGVDPHEMFETYSADTIRLLILADVAPTSHRNWNNNTFPGILKWQKRLWLTIRDFINYRTNPPPKIPDDEFKTFDDYMFDSRNYYIKGTTFNYCGSQQHSVAISKQQGLTNSIRRAQPDIYARSLQFERALAAQIILLAPMAPHFASELWSGFLSAPNRLSQSGEIDWCKTVLDQQWPTIDSNYNMDLLCYINGDEMCTVKVPKEAFDAVTKEEAIRMAEDQAEIRDKLAENVVDSVEFTIKEEYSKTIHFKTKYVQKEKEICS